MPEQVTYDSFLRLIEGMVKRRESGVLYLRTDQNHSVFVGIRNGEIESLVSGLKRGAKAIQTLLEMTHGSYRRVSSRLTIQSEDLPPTAKIIQILKNRNAEPEPDEPDEPDEPTVPVQTEYEPTETEVSIDSTHAAKALCELLHDYIGPVAPIVCDDVIQGGARIGSPSDLDVVILELADEIDSVDEAREFMRRARERLDIS